jgi:hypothetical protein
MNGNRLEAVDKNRGVKATIGLGPTDKKPIEVIGKYYDTARFPAGRWAKGMICK